MCDTLDTKSGCSISSHSPTLVVGDLSEDEGEDDLDAVDEVERAGVGWKATMQHTRNQ